MNYLIQIGKINKREKIINLKNEFKKQVKDHI